MTQDEVLLVAGAIGLALTITLVDLVLSMLRHGRSTRVRSYSSRLGNTPQDEAVDQVRREWIRRRLSAIQTAASDPANPSPRPNPHVG